MHDNVVPTQNTRNEISYGSNQGYTAGSRRVSGFASFLNILAPKNPDRGFSLAGYVRLAIARIGRMAT